MYVQLDLSAFEGLARQLNAAIEQVPYALSRAMNDAAFATRQRLSDDTWPRSVKVRNPSFIRAALRVEKSSKYDLEVHIHDITGRGNLYQHAYGGESFPFSGRHVAIPAPGRFDRGPRGIAKRDRPSAIVARTPKRALRVTDRGIFVGEGGRLKLMYTLKASATMKHDVPFAEDFERFFLEELHAHFEPALANAMATARPKR